MVNRRHVHTIFACAECVFFFKIIFTKVKARQLKYNATFPWQLYFQTAIFRSIVIADVQHLIKILRSRLIIGVLENAKNIKLL